MKLVRAPFNAAARFVLARRDGRPASRVRVEPA